MKSKNAIKNMTLTASFITALPGILIQLVFLTSVVLTLMKAKIIPVRYAKGKAVA